MLDDISVLLTMGEGQTLDFKQQQESQTRIAEQIAAFANAQGGRIVFGIAKDDHTVVGVDAAHRKALREQIARAARHSVEPPLEVKMTEIQYGGRTLILCDVPIGRDAIYQAGGRVVQRQQDQNVTLRAAEVLALGLRRGLIVFEQQVVAGATLDDLDLAAVEQHLAAAATRRGSAFDEAEEALPVDPWVLLRVRGCITEAIPGGGLQPTVAGILFFGRHPQQFLDHANITITHFFGTDTSRGYKDRRDLYGRVPDLIDQATNYLWERIAHGASIPGAPIGAAVIPGPSPSLATRIEIPEYPLAVLRELITNAVAHRAYEIAGSRIRISLFDDRLEVASPGGLSGHITVENILREQYSRNPQIVRLLYERGYIEELGLGLDNVYAWLTAENRPLPQIEDTGGGLIVTLPSPFAAVATTPPPTLSQPALDTVPARLRARRQAQQVMLGYLAQHGPATIGELAALLPGRAPRSINADLRELIDQGTVVRTGKSGRTRYALAGQPTHPPRQQP